MDDCEAVPVEVQKPTLGGSEVTGKFAWCLVHERPYDVCQGERVREQHQEETGQALWGKMEDEDGD